MDQGRQGRDQVDTAACRTFAANAVRLQLHAKKLIKIGAKAVSHGRYIIFQMAEVAIARRPRDFAAHRGATAAATARASMKRSIVTRSRAIDRRNASRCQ